MNPFLQGALGTVVRETSGLVTTVANPAILAAQYSAAEGLPKVIIPAPGELLDCLVHGRLMHDQYAWYMRYHGIDVVGSGGGVVDTRAKAALWQALEASKWTVPPVATLLAIASRDGWSEEATERYLAYHGIKSDMEYWTEAPWDWTPEQIRVVATMGAFDPESGSLGVAGQDAYTAWLKGAGLRRPQDRNLFEKLIQPPTYHECIQARNRGLIDQATFDRWITLEGFTDPATKKCLTDLRAEIPTVAELIGFSVKNVFSKAIVDKYRYNDEFDEQPNYQLWMARNGYIGNPTLSADQIATALAAGDITQELADALSKHQNPDLNSWAQAHWWDHWINLSPTQAYTCMHRLRPTDATKPAVAGKLQPRVPTVPGSAEEVPPITMSDVDLILRVNDYVPYFRPALAAISYNVLRLVDIRRIVELKSARSRLPDADYRPSSHLQRRHADCRNKPGSDHGGESAFSAVMGPRTVP